MTIENKPEDPPPPLSGRRKGFQSGATMSCAQVSAELMRHQRTVPGAIDCTPDDLMTGVVASVLARASRELADYIIAEGEKQVPAHLDLMRKMRARGVRITVQVQPLANGEGEMDDIMPLPLAEPDVEVIAAPGTENGCGVLGCTKLATHVIRSMIANTGCWACEPHAAEVERAIARKWGGT